MRYIVNLVARNKNTGAKLETKLVLGQYIESAGGYLVQSITTHLTKLSPDSLKAGDSSLPESVKSENALPAESG
jgi:hypothetical protein